LIIREDEPEVRTGAPAIVVGSCHTDIQILPQVIKWTIRNGVASARNGSLLIALV
jgi:hypothetical protein